jgi:hypothetical protein
MPDDPAQLPAWLEGHLLGGDLHEIVTELGVLGGPADGQPVTLPQVLGDQAGDVLQLGLGCLSRGQLRQLMQRPKLLLDLQELVLEQGGEYWLTARVNEEVANQSQQTWQRLQETIREETKTMAAAATGSMTRDRRAWWWAATGWLAATAACVALLFVRTYRVQQLETRVAQQSAEIDTLRKDLLAQRQAIPADLPEMETQLVHASADPPDLPDDDPPDLPETH